MFFVPCPDCARHVRSDEHRCPFCSRPLQPSEARTARLPQKRLGRAATFAFGATLLGAAALTSCGGEADEDDAKGKGGAGGRGGTAGTGTSASGGEAPGGAAGAGAGGPGSAGVAGVSIAPPYGIPPQR